MDIDPTLAAVGAVALVIGVTVFHLTVIDPHRQRQRILQAEQAERELVEEQENQSKRGSNKQAKKK